MPWCPRCDETFPEGPACPRCSARLIARDRDDDAAFQNVAALRGLKVSRRYRKAFDRLSGPRTQSSRALVVALVAFVFASGFLLGRVGEITGPSQGPTVRGLPGADPLTEEGVSGAVSYLVATSGLATIASHDLWSGDVAPVTRVSSPFTDSLRRASTRVVSFGRSVALVVSDGRRSFVAATPSGDRPPQAWIPGVEAAWSSESELLIRRENGQVVRWTSGDATTAQMADGADALIQTSAGAVVRRGRLLETAGPPQRSLTLPRDANVLAVSPDTTKALILTTGAALWDGRTAVPVRTAPGRVLGASFDASGERAALLLRNGDELTLGIVDARGDTALKPLGGGSGCRTAPAWDAQGTWVYVAAGDGAFHAVEASGGRIRPVSTQGVGCGMAWTDISS